jgi:hypothetical protein
MATKSSPKAEKVWAYLLKNKLATPAEVAKATGVSYGYVYKLMKKVGTPKEVFEEEAKSTAKKPQTANLRQVGGQHYVGLSVEPWDAMQAWMTKDEFVGFLKGNIIKYLARTKNANDLDKAGHYMQKLLEVK